MKTSAIIAVLLPLLAAGADVIEPRQTAKTTLSTSACPSLWAAITAEMPPLPTAIQEYRSSLQARITDVCMSFVDIGGVPASLEPELRSWSIEESSWLRHGPGASVYTQCSDWINSPISYTDASQIASYSSRMSAYESCSNNNKISTWWETAPAGTRTSTASGATVTTAAATKATASGAGQSIATSAPPTGAGAQNAPIGVMTVAVAAVIGGFVVVI